MNLTEVSALVWIQEHVRVPALNGIVSAISHLGDAGIFWIVLTLVLIAIKKTRKVGICCAVSMVFTLLVVNCCLKPIVARIRPYDLPEMANILKILVPAEHDFSFPSGHSSNSFACAWVLFRGKDKRIGIPAIVLASLIALSRLYVGVHYPTDVICGILAGVLCAQLAIRVTPSIRKRVRKAMRKRSQARR